MIRRSILPSGGAGDQAPHRCRIRCALIRWSTSTPIRWMLRRSRAAVRRASQYRKRRRGDRPAVDSGAENLPHALRETQRSDVDEAHRDACRKKLDVPLRSRSTARVRSRNGSRTSEVGSGRPTTDVKMYNDPARIRRSVALVVAGAAATYSGDPHPATRAMYDGVARPSRIARSALTSALRCSRGCLRLRGLTSISFWKLTTQAAGRGARCCVWPASAAAGNRRRGRHARVLRSRIVGLLPGCTECKRRRASTRGVSEKWFRPVHEPGRLAAQTYRRAL